ncbi:hypothetical protein FOMPIDRAFT_133237 [Fomitopsis schrenkii]|uniref:Uncharacterized protein n=1 Tax=Fomitopsis schrenkii TaxID=2126942 RepID=S8EY08_FOMSC|nr:hypothetical protein FOMPIDRAFT_133237 [Fomitopsis schrenkii]
MWLGVPTPRWTPRPDRWNCIAERAQEVHGTWSNIMAFLRAPPSCIDYRSDIGKVLYALVEASAVSFCICNLQLIGPVWQDATLYTHSSA